MNWDAVTLKTDYRYVVVDRTTWGETRELTDITGGSISRKYLSTLKEGATLDYEDTAQITTVGNDYVRIYLDATDGEQTESVALGTFMVSTPSQTKSDLGVNGTATLYSLLQIVQDEGLSEILTIPAETNVITYAAGLLSARGLNVHVQNESSVATAKDTVFDTENTVLDVVIWCTQAADFGTPLIDGYGNILLQRYTDPTLNAPIVAYDGASKVLFPEYTHELDTFSMPNKVVVVSSTPDSAVVGSATNADPASPYSTATRGRTITATYSVDNLETTAQANEKAEALLRSLSLVEAVEVEHLYNDTHLQDVFSIYDDGNYAIVNQDITLEPGCPVKDRGRRFV